MSQISVSVVSPEEAYDGITEFWCGAEPDATSLAEEATRPLAAY